jgi:hypothetical protein
VPEPKLAPSRDIRPYTAAFDALLLEAREKLDPDAREILLLCLRIRLRGESVWPE